MLLHLGLVIVEQLEEERRNLFDSNTNTITIIDNIIQQLITKPGCQKTILVNYAGHLNTYNFCFNYLN